MDGGQNATILVHGRFGRIKMTKPIARMEDYILFETQEEDRWVAIFKPTGSKIHTFTTMSKKECEIQIEYDIGERNRSRLNFWYISGNKWKI